MSLEEIGVKRTGQRPIPPDWLITPAAAFNHPDDVLSHSRLTVGEKGVILCLVGLAGPASR
jgi:hypothetical protein